MIFRKAKQSHTTSGLVGRDRRRRDQEPAEDAPREDGAGANAPAPTRPGPYDASEIDTDTSRTGRLDLGGLQIRPRQDFEVRLQVNEETQTVMAVLLVQGDSALELRAFAAPRSESIWDEIRREIAADTGRRGGLATERKGPYGVELEMSVPMRAPDGSNVTQTSRIIGVDGPRWFLRATLLGRASQDPSAAAALMTALADVVVVRGKAPMAPRDMIPLKLPASPEGP